MKKINLWWKGQAYIIAKKYKLSVYKGESFVGLTLGVDIVKLLSPRNTFLRAQTLLDLSKNLKSEDEKILLKIK